MTDKLTSDEFVLVRDALEMSARDLLTAIEKQCEVSLQAFRSMEHNGVDRETALHISDVHKLLMQLFKVRFPGAFDDLFPNGY